MLTYQRVYGLSQQQFCDELFLGYQHLVNIDFHHAWEQTRPYAGTWHTLLDTLNGGWLQPRDTLEDYGFHIIPLPEGYNGTPKVKGSSLRWTVVGISADGHTSTMYPAPAVTPLMAAVSLPRSSRNDSFLLWPRLQSTED